MVVSIISSALFFFISTFSADIWREFFINISASMLVIAVTVILVDVLRERRLEGQYKIPRDVAVNKILGAHSVISLSLALKNSSQNRSILKNIMNHVREYASQVNALGLAAKDAFIKFEGIAANTIVAGFTQEELINTLKPQIQSLRKNYSDTTDKYIFSFSDAVMRADYAELVEALDSVLGAIEIIEINKGELEKIIKSKDSPDSSNPVTANEFLGAVLINYITIFNKFTRKYASQ